MSLNGTAYIDGGIPLNGSVYLQGSRVLSLKLIYASLLGVERCKLFNVPKVKYVLEDIEIISRLGVKFEWGPNYLSIDPSSLESFEVVEPAVSKINTICYVVPALIHKFGKAIISKSYKLYQYAKIWELFGLRVLEYGDKFIIEGTIAPVPEITLPYPSRSLTDMCVIMGVLSSEEVLVLNPSLDVETDDLISFCNELGADILRNDNGQILIRGTSTFKKVEREITLDREEAVFFLTLGFLTNGNLIVENIDRVRILSFLNWLNKINVQYEFIDQDIRVWKNKEQEITPFEIKSTFYPGFITDFVPFAMLSACFARGKSVIVEHALSPNYEFGMNLKALGADILIEKQGDELSFVINSGEKEAKLLPAKIKLSSSGQALLSLFYALSVEGRHEISNFSLVDKNFLDITSRLKSLGGLISFVD